MVVDISKIRALDTETPRFRAGEMAPPIICASTAKMVNGRPAGELIADQEAALDRLEEYLDFGYTIVFANAAYDLAVAAQARPRLIPKIFAAIRDGRVFDILIAQSLDAIYRGHLGLNEDFTEMRVPSTGKVTNRYGLEIVTFQLTGRTDAKANDVWRESYALLKGISVSEWPREAREYPIDDACNTLEDAIVQLSGRPGVHEWYEVPPLPGGTEAITLCRYCGEQLTYAGALPTSCAKAPLREHKNLENMAAQVEAAFALWLGACHSLRTDPVRVEKLAEEVEGKHAAAVARFQKLGWIRPDGTEDTAVVKRAIALAYGATGNCKRCKGTGRVRNVEQIDCRGEKVRGRYQGCRGAECRVCARPVAVEIPPLPPGVAPSRFSQLDLDSSTPVPPLPPPAMMVGTGKVFRLGNEITCKNRFDAESGVLVEEGCDGTGFDLSTAPLLPRTDKMGVKTDRDTGMESGDDDISDFSENEFEKSRNVYVPYLRTGIDRPLQYSPNVLVATGRCSYEGCPLHQMPRSGGERSCIRARGKWCGYPIEMVLGSTDYEAGELCLSGGTRILTERGYLPIRELVGQRVRVASRFAGESDFTAAPAFHEAEVFSTGTKATLRITTIDGRLIECTENHPLLVQRMHGKRPHHNRGCDSSWKKTDFEWRPARDVRIGDSLVSGSMAIYDEAPKLDSKFYAFGHFLGDGWLTTNKSERRGGAANVGVCAGGAEAGLLESLVAVWEQITDEAEAFAPSVREYPSREKIELRHVKSHFSPEASAETIAASKGVVELRVKRHVAVARLLQEHYGFTSEKAPKKRLPSCYWRGTPDQKRSFLRGLFDADGSIVLSPRRSVSFTAANEELARDILMALSEFGIDARMTTHYIAMRERSQTILQIRGNENFERVAKHVLFVDPYFRSYKAEKLAAVVPKEIQHHRHGMIVKSIESGGTQQVFNLEVPTTRHYVAEGLVVHNCTLAQYCYWLFGASQMRDAINTSGKPGILHSDLAAEVLGIPLDEFLGRLKKKDKQAVDFRQMCKPINFGVPGRMGVAKLVLTSRKKNAGFTACPDGPARDEKGSPGYWGVRFCILTGGARFCGVEKVMEWKGYPCPPVCKACLKVVDEMLRPAYFRRYPEIRSYFAWAEKMIDAGKPAPSVVWDPELGQPRIIRERGGCEITAFCNNGFQSMLADIMKAAYCDATRECYLGAMPDGSPSPLYGCRLPLAVHDEPISELILATAHLSGPRIAEIMVAAGRRIAPDVVWKAETALAFHLNKSMEPVYVDATDERGMPFKKLVPWEPKK